MPQVDPVILQLKADLADYQRGMERAQRLSDEKLGAIEARASKMSAGVAKGFTLAKSATLAFVAAGGIAVLTDAIKTGLEYASSLGEQATALGVTTTALQEYRFAATQAGLSQEEMDQALGQLTRRTGEAATGVGQAADAYARLGVSFRDAEGNVRATGDLLPDIAEGLQRIESPAERAAILVDLFGRAGQKMGTLLGSGAAGVNNLRNAAHQLGIVLSEEQIARADETADKLAAVQTVLKANIAGAVANNANAILALANAFVQVVTWAGKAADAFTRFKLAQGIRTRDSIIDGWATSPEAKAKAQRERNAMQLQLNVMEGRTPFANTPAGRAAKAARDRAAAGGTVSANAPTVSLPGTGGAASVGGASAGGGGYSGPSAAEIEVRYSRELDSLTQRILSARMALATSAEERAELDLRQIEWDRRAALAEIDANEEYSKAQKAELRATTERLAAAEREAVEFGKRVQLEREAQDLAGERNRAEEDGLRAQMDMADTQAERKQLALAMLELEDRYKESLLEAVLASETTSDAEKQRAQVALQALRDTAGARREGTSRANETAVERYLREMKRTPEQINEASDGIKIDGLDALNDGLVDAIMGAESLGKMFKNVANQIVADLLRIAVQRSIIEPLAGALFGGNGGGGGGLFGSLLGGLTGGGSSGGVFGSISRLLSGRAGGGYVGPGQMYRVNEAGVEGFMPNGGGKIIPLGQMNAMRTPTAQGGGTATVRLELSGDIDARIQQVSGGVAVEVVRASQPALTNAAVNETMRRAGRPRL